jgi:hypothetical protein
MTKEQISEMRASVCRAGTRKSGYKRHRNKVTNANSDTQCRYNEIRLNLNATQEIDERNASIDRQGQYQKGRLDLK